MNRLILFVKKIYVLLLFIILEIAALNYYAKSTSYTKAKLLTASNSFTGTIHTGLSLVGDYFGLRRENDMLLEQLADAQNQLEYFKELFKVQDEEILPDGELGKYTYTTVSVINNSITRQENYIILDKGAREGLRSDMAIITPDGFIVGRILDVSEKYSAAISVLNTEFRTSGKIKDKDYFGSVFWDGTDHEYVTLSEIPKYADIEVGDTIVTGYSSIFPPDIIIGTVENFELVHSTYYNAKVKLSTRMSRLGRLFVVDYSDIEELKLLEENL